MEEKIFVYEGADVRAQQGRERVLLGMSGGIDSTYAVVKLRTLGYEIGAVTPVDLFPRTGHVESVVCLTRK